MVGTLKKFIVKHFLLNLINQSWLIILLLIDSETDFEDSGSEYLPSNDSGTSHVSASEEEDNETTLETSTTGKNVE